MKTKRHIKCSLVNTLLVSVCSFSDPCFQECIEAVEVFMNVPAYGVAAFILHVSHRLPVYDVLHYDDMLLNLGNEP